MAPTSNINKLLTKLAKGNKKTTSNRVKVPWRRKPRAPLRLSTADKIARRVKRKQTEQDVQQHLADTREVNWERASEMAEKFGHSKAYWYKQIIAVDQLKFKLNSVPRKISRWNVFVSQELKKRNNGESHAPCCIAGMLLNRPISFRRRAQEGLRRLRQSVVRALEEHAGRRAQEGHRAGF